jgi:hypothetical protein
MSMSSKWLLVAAVSLASLSLTAGANASVLFFQYTEGPGGVNFSFDQSSNPIPNGFGLNFSTDVPVTNWTSNIGSASSITWFSLADSGGFETDTSNNNFAGSTAFGPQVYTGLESLPVFAPGTFDMVDQDNGLSGVLTVTTVTATPLPPAWTMLIAGFVGLGFLAYRSAKKNTTVLAAA